MRWNLPALIVCSLLAVVNAWADTRVALVIGNSAYEKTAQLPNTRNDANAVAQALESVGFAVDQADDLDFDAMRRALQQFSRTAEGADMAVIYYAGHGMEVGGTNYLIPVDAVLASDRDIDFEAVPLQRLSDALNGAAGLKLVMLDACRNNPFDSAMKRSVGTRAVMRGLSRVEPVQGTLISFAAREGTVASDGQTGNSPYATALVRELVKPGLEVQFLFRRIRDSVLKDTGGKQEPFLYGSLPSEEIYLVPAASETTPPAPAPDTPSNAPLELAFWQAVQDSGDAAMLQSYIDQFPVGTFVSLARLKLAALDSKTAAAPPALSPAQDAVPVPEAPVLESRLGVLDAPPIANDNPPVAAAPGAPWRGMTGYFSVEELAPRIASLPAPIRALIVETLPHPGVGEPDGPPTECDRLASDLRHPDAKWITTTKKAVLDYGTEAIKACEAAEQADPSSTRFAAYTGRAWMIAKHYPQALEAFARAAKLGDPYAMTAIGDILAEAGPDAGIARKWYEKAAKAGGYTHAWRGLGDLAANDDPVAAEAIYRRGMEAGDDDSTVKLAARFAVGDGLPEDKAKSLETLAIAARSDDAEILLAVGREYARSSVLDRQEDSFEIFAQAFREGGSPEAIDEIARNIDSGVAGVRDALSATAEDIATMRMIAANYGASESLFNIGLAHQYGLGVGQDDIRANALFAQAAKYSGYPRLHLALRMAQGIGGPVDIEGAVKLLFSGEPTDMQIARASLIQPEEFAKVPAELRYAIQRELTDKGLYSGPIDGVSGPKLELAFAAWTDQTFTETKLDPAWLEALGVLDPDTFTP